MKKLIIGAIVAASATTAFAWGDREQGALLGLIIGNVITSRPAPPAPVYQAPPHYFYVAPPLQLAPQRLICGMNVVCPQQLGQTCLQHPYYDQYGNLVGYQLSCH